MEAETWKVQMVDRCGHSWVKAHTPFRMALGIGHKEEKHELDYYITTNTGRKRASDKAFFVCDPDKRGFLLIVSRDDYNELYFALVDEPFRRQGVLRGLVRRLDPDIPLWLECRHDVAGVWKSMGFKLTKHPDPESSSESSCGYEFERKAVSYTHLTLPPKA